ncbi:MAG: Asp23/Gls24 family envelope stress response protein [Clostridia bacterium]|nr:Asp23/Gls24 family envelope stress response protein [Clostridia bacterium]
MEENEVKSEIEIAEEVIAVIAGTAVQNVEGIAKVSAGFAGGIQEALGRKTVGKGIKVDISEDKSVKIDIGITVVYGVKIQDVAANIQAKVKEDVENMTGYKVAGVVVRVESVAVPEDNKDEQ